MVSIKRAVNYLMHNRTQFCDSLVKNFLCFLPDKAYLSLRFRLQMGYWMNWRNPKTFSEKIQWLKVYNRKSEYTTMVDKYAVKKYVAERIGEEYIIPTLYVWDKPEDINWDILPNQFVLKTTHGGGGCGVVVCKDKDYFDKEKAVVKLQSSLNSDIYLNLREWPYKDVPRRVIAEKMLKSSLSLESDDLTDYKFFCFNGVPKYCQVIRDRHSRETIDFYDMDWIHQEFVGLNTIAYNGEYNTFCNGDTPVSRPKQLDNMIEICRILAKDLPFIRVDLYVVDDKIYFGELTFFPASGFGTFTPESWQLKLGDMLII